ATSILDSKQRQFCYSSFVRLEILTKAKHHKKQDEVNFYETFFAHCQIYANDLDTIVNLAEELAEKYGLNALDALQIASAISVNAEEFITTEKTTKSLHRVIEIKVTSIAD
ncbi:MAG TPA: PIN domain-containing protein, partial [Allocoleopsis sp.]